MTVSVTYHKKRNLRVKIYNAKTGEIKAYMVTSKYDDRAANLRQELHP